MSRSLPLEKMFPAAILASLVIHGVALFQTTILNLPALDRKQQKVEVRYLKQKEQPRLQARMPLPRKERFLKLSSPVTMKNVPPPFVDKEDALSGGKENSGRDFAFVKPSFARPDSSAIRKKISLPPVDLEKINNPSYISYYQLIREKIKRAAYQNYTSSEVGEVYLSFIVSSDGYIRQARLVEEKSSPSAYLREIAMNSISSASPFPDFPKELDYPQLSFNVIISFEVE